MTNEILGQDYDWQMVNMIKSDKNAKMVKKITDKERWMVRGLNIKQKLNNEMLGKI